MFVVHTFQVYEANTTSGIWKSEGLNELRKLFIINIRLLFRQEQCSCSLLIENEKYTECLHRVKLTLFDG